MSDQHAERDHRRCTNCGKSVEDESYMLWLFHTCRSCALEPAPKRWGDGRIARGTCRKWAYYPRWHLVEHPEREAHWRTRQLVTDGGIPKEHPERFEWIVERARRLDFIRDDGAGWVAEELEKLWDDPEGYANGENYEVPDGVAQEDYALFKLGVNFGVEYEREYPTDGDWREENE